MIPQISARAVAAKIEAGEPVYLLDVRQPWEHEIARLRGSVLVPLGELPDRVAEVRAAEGVLVIVYCHHGIRSLAGVDVLRRAGFLSVASLIGGIDAWSVEIDADVTRY